MSEKDLSGKEIVSQFVSLLFDQFGFGGFEKRLNKFEDLIMSGFDVTIDASLEEFLKDLKVSERLEAYERRLGVVEENTASVLKLQRQIAKSLGIKKVNSKKSSEKPAKKVVKTILRKKTITQKKNLLIEMRPVLRVEMEKNKNGITIKQARKVCAKAGYEKHYLTGGKKDKKKFSRAVSNAISKDVKVLYIRESRLYRLRDNMEVAGIRRIGS